MVTLLLASLFFTTPAPLEMPKASAYFVCETDGRQRLEDRYSCFDLWRTQSVVGRWIDDDGRVFTLAELKRLPPALASDETRTRVDYAESAVAPERRNVEHLRRMVDALSPVDLAPEPERPHQLPHGFKEVLYFQGTNDQAIVCAFKPEASETWLYASWELVDGDLIEELLIAFEERFLEQRAYEQLTPFAQAKKGDPSKNSRPSRTARRSAETDERERLREDVGRSVAAYPAWRLTSSDEFVIIDDLVTARGFVTSVTNELPRLRQRFAATIPSPLAGSNTLAVARIFADRQDYLEAAGEDMAWSAAYWNQARRELVACLPENGDTVELMRTFRHESFHQYLSYAASMIPTSPWFNEGYAQYFEDDAVTALGLEVPEERWDTLEHSLPGLMMMDYAEFYAGSDAERRTKYRLAWSIAYFIEHGAPKVRFEPFKNLKRDYLAAILKTQDMRRATTCAFGTVERIEQFANEWKTFWKNR